MSSVIKDELNEANDDGHTASIGKQVRRPKSRRLQTLKREKLAAMRNLKERKVSLRNYMKRIGSLSEKYDRRAQAEGFTKKREGDSDAEFSENEDIPIQKSQQKNLTNYSIPDLNSTEPVNPNFNSLLGDALRDFRKNLH